MPRLCRDFSPLHQDHFSRQMVHQRNLYLVVEVYDFKSYAQGADDDNVKVFAPLFNISFNHVFMIKRVEAKNLTLLFAKQYSSLTQWELV
jgi:hypothetical protein